MLFGDGGGGGDSGGVMPPYYSLVGNDFNNGKRYVCAMKPCFCVSIEFPSSFFPYRKKVYLQNIWLL